MKKSLNLGSEDGGRGTLGHAPLFHPVCSLESRHPRGSGGVPFRAARLGRGPKPRCLGALQVMNMTHHDNETVPLYKYQFSAGAELNPFTQARGIVQLACTACLESQCEQLEVWTMASLQPS